MSSFICKNSQIMSLRYTRRLLIQISKRAISSSPLCASKKKVTLADPIEHATGPEKRELLAKVAGNEHPWDMKVIKRGAGTRSQPNEIPSAFERRLVGCICEDESVSINYMWLYKGEPKRCECGHWFALVHKAPM